jgi:NDP-mannose synthase
MAETIRVKEVTMRAIVLAGGKGTRLKPYSLVFPKPMLPIGGIPILETILRQLKYFGFEQTTISLGYMPGIIRSYFNEIVGDEGIPELDYFVEKTPLGTAGPIKLIEKAEDNFLVMNGDILSTLDLKALYNYHIENEAALTLAVRSTKFTVPLGVIEFDGNNQITEFKEKPSFQYFDNIGIYVYNKSITKYIDSDTNFGVNTLVERLISNQERVMAFFSKEPYYWIDIGQHGDYDKANEEFDKIRNEFGFLNLETL